MHSRQISKRGTVRIHIEVPVAIIDQFTTLYPHYGQLTAFVRKSLEKHLSDVEKDMNRLLEE